MSDRTDPVTLVAIEFNLLSMMLPGYFATPPGYVVDSMTLDVKGQLRGTSKRTPTGYTGELRQEGIERVDSLKAKLAKVADKLPKPSAKRANEVLDAARELLQKNDVIPEGEVSNVAGRLRKVADQLRESDRCASAKRKSRRTPGPQITPEQKRDDGAVESLWEEFKSLATRPSKADVSCSKKERLGSQAHAFSWAKHHGRLPDSIETLEAWKNARERNRK